MPDIDKRIPRLIFLTVLCIGLFTMQGKVRDSDAFPMLLTTQAICERGTFAISNLAAPDNPRAAEWANMYFTWAHLKDFHYGDSDIPGDPEAVSGRDLYSKYGLAASAVFIPLWLIGMLLASLFGLEGADRLSFIVFIAGFTMPILLASSAALLYRIGRFLGYTPRTSAFLSIALAVCSNLLVYGGMYMSEVTQVAFLLMGWYFLFGFIFAKKPVMWAFIAGLGYTLMMLTKFADVIYTLPLFFLLIARMGGAIYGGFRRLGKGLPVDASEFRRNAYGIGAILLGLLIFPMIFYYYNYVRFGNPMQTGYISEYQQLYIPIYLGLIGFLVSPGKSLFIYFPPAVLFFWAIRMFIRKYPFEFWFFVIHAAVQILLYSRLIYWSGFWSWGPRYSLLILPALLLPVGVLLDGDGAKRYINAFRRLCYAGTIIQFPVLIIHFNDFIRLMKNTFGEGILEGCYIKMFYNPMYSPVLCNWWLLISKAARTIFHVEIPIWGMSTSGYTATKLFMVALSRDVPALSPLFIIIAVFTLAGAIYAGLNLKRLLKGV